MRLIKYILSFLPSKLPTGMTAYRAWQDDIIFLVGPIADERSLRWTIANMVMHAPSDGAFLSKQYFVRRLVKTAANQLSAQVFQDIKLAQEVEQQAAEDAANRAKIEALAEPLTQVEATTSPVEASDEKPKETAQS